MYLPQLLFVVTVFLFWLMKVHSENIPYCKTAVWIYFTPACTCYNYKTLPIDLGNATELREFTIKSQKLEELKNGELRAANLTNLEVLILSNNAIKTIELGAFEGASKIKYLYLSTNQIGDIDLLVFKDLPSLEELYLDGNPLQRFLSEFPKLGLTNLDLGNCRIHSIPPNLFKNLDKLESLYLQNNQLEILDWKVFLPLKSLNAVILEGNPFHCDCQVKLLLDFLDMKKVSWDVNSYIPPSCQSSSTSLNRKLIGVEWDKLDRELLVCPQQVDLVTLKLIIGVLVAIVVFLLGVIITSGIYISIRYSKTKRNELPTNIYATIPRESKPNTASKAVGLAEDPPGSPLLDGQENPYEVCGEADNFYEIPTIPLNELHTLNSN